MAASVAQQEESDGGATYRMVGAITIARAASTAREIENAPDPLTIDLSEVSRMDTVGAWLVYRTVRDRQAKVVGASSELQSLLDQVAEADKPARVRPEESGGFGRVVRELGVWVIEVGHTLVGLLGFFGATLLGFVALIRRPKRFRFNSVVQRFDVVGVRALGIIGLMSFLIGIVVGQQGAVQLQQFGAEVYTINLIGRITVRELGVLMTAIMVAGRSGSAFAAQIGTMKLTEEVDAMRTIGVSPIEALVIPRMIAAVVMMPLLGMWAILSSLLGGGLFVWLVLGIPPATYVQRLQEVIPMTDLWIALIKAPVFGFIIALAGCFQGMLVEGDSEAVGRRTTTAVVQSIFLVIVLDAVFAVFFSSIGWR
ncbi:MlaE family lipid ABC transporter permease subunit [Sphingomonas sinipercae]|uniref:MlaE family lipid ABC transporter permease subunit n=1 Tax=Sphingomonas sinipercae TaxID=2714944 RepID=A0A6G7ZLA8_9SPHN|nr:MlaE family lipid ABC transporter permease subunit [Sphingomonas sinipercae]QIL01761.1 MlaE family lipid ABC transporter permease subunit [Sphingomonas sinipercae]